MLPIVSSIPNIDLSLSISTSKNFLTLTILGSMDVEDEASDTLSEDSLVLELAAHPLSSPNPPPQDLPDLSDELITSEAEVRRRWVMCDQLVHKLAKRVINVKKRLELLRQAYPQYCTDAMKAKKGWKTNPHLCFCACEEMYQRMFMQANFMHYCLTRRIKPLLQQHLKAHKNVFDALLGDRHDHRGIDVADSKTLQCGPDCNWYIEHGPYEWTKRPYTHEWWKEMNGTNWDWVSMRQHITEVTTEARDNGIVKADMLVSNARKYVPVWFWYEKFQTWSPHVEVLRVQNENGSMEEKVGCKIRFDKTEVMMKKEREYKLDQAKHQGGVRDSTGKEGTEDESGVEVSAVGEWNIDPAVVFDGHAYSPDDGNGGQLTSIGSWLGCLGYQQWSDSYFDSASQRPSALAESKGAVASTT